MNVLLPRPEPQTSIVGRVGILLLGFAATGCSVQTTIPDLPNDLPASWDAQALQSSAHVSLDVWWKAFDDPTLDRLVAVAREDNLTLKIASERVSAARHLHHRSRADFWPNLNFRVYPETAPNADTGYLEMGFDSTWELGLFGRSEGNARMNAADLNMTLIDESAARITVTAEVARSYLDLCAAGEHLRLMNEVVATRERQNEVAQARLRLHLASRRDADKAKADLNSAQANAEEAAIPVAESKAGLSVLLGHRISEVELPQTCSVPALSANVADQPPADLVRTRPEIRRAQQAVVRAAGELGIARADLYPKLSIVGTLLSSTPLTGDVDRPSRAIPLIGPSITIPLIDWHARRAVVGAREAALSAAVFAYQEAVLEGVADVEAAMARFQTRTTLIASADDEVRLARQVLDTAVASRRIGLVDDEEVASAGIAFAQAQEQRLQAAHEKGLSYIALSKAFGGAIPMLVSAP